MIEYKKYTVFGFSAMVKPTPAWVKRTLAIVLVLLGAISNFCYATSLIPEAAKPEILLITGTLAGTLAAIAPFFGVKTKPVNR